MAANCVRRDKAALSSECKSHPGERSSRKQPAFQVDASPTGERSSRKQPKTVMEVTKWLKPSVWLVTYR